MVVSYINQSRSKPSSSVDVFLTTTKGAAIMSTRREKMKQEMILFGLAESTQERYLQATTKLYEHYNKSPAKLSVDELKAYLMTLKKRI